MGTQRGALGFRNWPLGFHIWFWLPETRAFLRFPRSLSKSLFMFWIIRTKKETSELLFWKLFWGFCGFWEDFPGVGGGWELTLSFRPGTRFFERWLDWLRLLLLLDLFLVDWLAGEVGRERDSEFSRGFRLVPLRWMNVQFSVKHAWSLTEFLHSLGWKYLQDFPFLQPYRWFGPKWQSVTIFNKF